MNPSASIHTDNVAGLDNLTSAEQLASARPVPRLSLGIDRVMAVVPSGPEGYALLSRAFQRLYVATAALSDRADSS